MIQTVCNVDMALQNDSPTPQQSHPMIERLEGHPFSSRTGFTKIQNLFDWPLQSSHTATSGSLTGIKVLQIRAVPIRRVDKDLDQVGDSRVIGGVFEDVLIFKIIEKLGKNSQ